MKCNSRNHLKCRFNRYHHGFSGRGRQEGTLVKNISTVSKGFLHTSDTEVNPRRVEGEQNFTFINQAGQLKQHIYTTPKRRVYFESLFNFTCERSQRSTSLLWRTLNGAPGSMICDLGNNPMKIDKALLISMNKVDTNEHNNRQCGNPFWSGIVLGSVPTYKSNDVM